MNQKIWGISWKYYVHNAKYLKDVVFVFFLKDMPNIFRLFKVVLDSLRIILSYLSDLLVETDSKRRKGIGGFFQIVRNLFKQIIGTPGKTGKSDTGKAI